MIQNAISDMRAGVLLSVQRALLGEVFPALRGVSIELDDSKICLVCIVDGMLSSEDAESLSCIESEVMADFPEEYEVSLETVRCDAPAEMPTCSVWAYRRRE